MSPVMLLLLAAQLSVPKIVKPPVLKCGENQHQEHTPGRCSDNCSGDRSICTTKCWYLPPEDKCVDDTHQVTEKEWQKLLFRLAELESRGR